MLKRKNPLTELPLVNVGVDAPSSIELPEGNVVSLEKRRTSVDLSLKSQEELHWLCDVTGGSNKTDVIRMSLYLFWMLASMEKRNQAVIIRDEGNNNNTLFVPSLNAINSMLRTSGKDDRLRLTLELSSRAMRELDELKNYTGENKKADVIRQSIHINYVLLNEVHKGRKVVIREPSGAEFDLFVPASDQGEEPGEPVDLQGSIVT